MLLPCRWAEACLTTQQQPSKRVALTSKTSKSNDSIFADLEESLETFCLHEFPRHNLVPLENVFDSLIRTMTDDIIESYILKNPVVHVLQLDMLCTFDIIFIETTKVMLHTHLEVLEKSGPWLWDGTAPINTIKVYFGICRISQLQIYAHLLR